MEFLKLKNAITEHLCHQSQERRGEKGKPGKVFKKIMAEKLPKDINL